jgi:hypothetical protein
MLLFTFPAQWTWHDCKEALMQAELMGDEAGPPTVHVFDLTASELPQQALIPLLRRCLQMRLSYRVRKTIFIERPHLTDLLAENLRLVLRDVEKHNFDVTDSLPRARALSQLG